MSSKSEAFANMGRDLAEQISGGNATPTLILVITVGIIALFVIAKFAWGWTLGTIFQKLAEMGNRTRNIPKQPIQEKPVLEHTISTQPVQKPVTTTEVRYCMYCGERIPNGAQFCMKCGQKIQHK